MKKILMVSSEAVPYIKTGGLGETVGALSNDINTKENDIRIIIPKYACMDAGFLPELQFVCHFYVDLNWRHQYVGIFKAEHEGITYYFVDNEFYFSGNTLYGSMHEDIEKFAYFSKAVLVALPFLDFCPDVIHCNDWQTGLLPVFLKTVYRQDPYYCGIKTVFTVYNMQYQGRWGIRETIDITGLPEQMFTEDKLGEDGDANYLKGGCVYADIMTYASEVTSEQYEQIYEKLVEV